MKRNMIKSLFAMMAGALLLTTTACENGDQEFDDFTYQTVYFAYQTPIRTITLGTDVYSTELDNQHKCQLQVTVGGVWKNRQDRMVQLAVDNSLCNGLTFEDGTPVTPMPSSYYTIDNTNVTIKSGEVRGIAEVQLTDAFFADPQSLGVHYVIPVKIVSAQDSILEGKDYMLYAVTYKNKWEGTWICHGTDEIDLNGVKSTVTREAEYLEKNELRALTSNSLTSCDYALSTSVDVDTTTVNAQGQAVTTKDKKTLNAVIQLNFDANGQCTLTTTSPGCTVTGTGTWVAEGAKKAWGDQDRDLLTLSYTLTYRYTDNGVAKYKTFVTKEELVMQSRGNKFELFTTK
jgi:hypothetical protein